MITHILKTYVQRVAADNSIIYLRNSPESLFRTLILCIFFAKGCVGSGKFVAAIEEIIASNIDVAVTMAGSSQYHFESENIPRGKFTYLRNHVTTSVKNKRYQKNSLFPFSFFFFFFCQYGSYTPYKAVI